MAPTKPTTPPKSSLNTTASLFVSIKPAADVFGSSESLFGSSQPQPSINLFGSSQSSASVFGSRSSKPPADISEPNKRLSGSSQPYEPTSQLERRRFSYLFESSRSSAPTRGERPQKSEPTAAQLSNKQTIGGNKDLNNENKENTNGGEMEKTQEQGSFSQENLVSNLFESTNEQVTEKSEKKVGEEAIEKVQEEALDSHSLIIKPVKPIPDPKTENEIERDPALEELLNLQEGDDDSDALKLPYCEIDDTGDLLVTCYLPENKDANSGPIGVLRVCSKALSLASPLLRNQLRSQTYTSEVRKISFTASSLDEAIIVMNIVHHQNASNPGTLSLTELYNLATFCEEYQFQEAVLPSMDSWTKSLWPGPSQKPHSDLSKGGQIPDLASSKRTELPLHNTSFIDSHAPGDCVRWLWIAHVFGIKVIIEECGHVAIYNMRMTEPSEASFEVDGTAFHPWMVPFARETLWKKRQMLAGQLIQLIEGNVVKFQEQMPRNTSACGVPGNSETVFTADQCDLYQLGKLFKLKLKLGYPGIELASQSLTEVCDTLAETFRVTADLGFYNKYGIGLDIKHKGCDVFEELRKSVWKIRGLDLRFSLLD
ncbi:hypothetical protein H072_5471 [Dactylellina haptotyla CBS 200.50]|uniref:BTB domain-containing protein n=1 Tax=Dactylellina haptotyla (strain CBS 200.50) TaxID=1284197 RepID=S8BZ43_DACHA|nr:hypothetical protein H072_5471 [Dactylellina haptotyla CBS 200.50]